MQIRLENRTGNRTGRFISYEYGTDLFGYWYIDKIKGRERGKLVDKWILGDAGSLIRVLDLELYKREVEKYEKVAFV